ncbi:cytochrome C (plasmid) [Alcanivorax sp. N3-2A]|nr:cytochrome C [Alcanivorax sp. N3-2A]ASK36804.1 cytochrome C [Alcanivorax sp. N3-2A]|tara:strand:- start:6991 stop:7593 length:603 start_codon:yes stop_codon:yes gene_type:complete
MKNAGNSAKRIVGVVGVALAGLSVIGAVIAAGRIETHSPYEGAASAVVDDKGALRVPADYQLAYRMLGSWAVAADDAPGSKEMHVVYASPGTIAAYRKDGHFPDGTVLVKEVFHTMTDSMTTGTVSSPGTLAGWFVMVKDDIGRFPENKLWGDGWGWAWFDATTPQKTTSTDYKTDCRSCHVPAQASDWIYTRGYPTLNR